MADVNVAFIGYIGQCGIHWLQRSMWQPLVAYVNVTFIGYIGQCGIHWLHRSMWQPLVAELNVKAMVLY